VSKKGDEMKKLLLVLNALVLMLTLSIVVLPKFWIVTVVGGADGPRGIVIPMIWSIYVGLVFVTAATTFSWLAKR
jgi:hypothetical protein